MARIEGNLRITHASHGPLSEPPCVTVHSWYVLYHEWAPAEADRVECMVPCDGVVGGFALPKDHPAEGDFVNSFAAELRGDLSEEDGSIYLQAMDKLHGFLDWLYGALAARGSVLLWDMAEDDGRDAARTHKLPEDLLTAQALFFHSAKPYLAMAMFEKSTEPGAYLLPACSGEVLLATFEN